MGFDWNKEGDIRRAERVPNGYTGKLEVIKVVYAKADGNKMIATDGSPRIGLVFRDPQARECSDWYTLSDKAAWKLAQVLTASGANVEKMTKLGITPAKFAEEKFGDANLLGRVFTGEVLWEMGQNGKEQSSVNPLRPRPGTAAPVAEPQADEIPI